MPKSNDDKKFLSDLTDALCGGMAEAAKDDGKAFDDAREARLNAIKPLYGRSFEPPPLNDDGSLVNPDADVTPLKGKGKGKKAAPKAGPKGKKKKK